jgi:MFS family permease
MAKKLGLNRNLAIIALIAVVNALGYGIIIPIIYTYSQKFGLTDFQNGLLFAIFSLCSFISTPFIGRLSDKYGRKPLLVISISGTAVSFLMAAFAPNAFFLFLARALDGITAGNIPVASAVISDTTPPDQRARGFGIIGAAFGFGFIFGPAISAATVGYGLYVPFVIAAIISVIAVILTFIFLPETNKHIGQVQKGKIFDIAKLVKAAFDPNVGMTLIITLIYNVAFGIFIFAYQPFSVKVLNFSANQIALVFTLFGIVGLVMQLLVIQRCVKWFGEKKTFSGALLVGVAAFLIMYFGNNIPVFIIGALGISIANSFVMPLIQTILSEETDEKSQGSILGLNTSYMNVGTIIGPILGGYLATLTLSLPFLFGSLITLVCFVLSFKILRKDVPIEHAF